MKGIQRILDEGTPRQVRALFEFELSTPDDRVLLKFYLWSRYFFPKFFQSEDAPFHYEMDMHRVRVYLGHEPDFLNIAFRGSAKTTRAKLFRAFVIANDTAKRKRYMRILSKDLGNAKQSATDIYNMLVSKRVRALYPEIFEKTESKREEQMGSFTTSTGIKVIADSIGTDQRGAVQDDARPDFDWYDDFETRLSLFSATTTHKIWANMEEAKNGLAKGGGSEYTCNYISERGNVHRLVETIEKRYTMIVPIAEKRNGVWHPTWERFSAEDVQRLTKRDDFEGEYLCKPSATRDVYIDRESMNRQVAIEPYDVIGGLKLFKKFNPENRVVGGSDVGGGVGLDHSTSVYIDLDCIPAQVIATRKTNEIKPDAYAHVIAKDGKRFDECYEAVEKNYGSTNDILKSIYPTSKLHKTQRAEGKVKFVKAVEYGWETNGATKPTMLADFCKAVEDGLLALNDEGLISEASSYTSNDLMDRDVDVRLTTRHFDLLMAAAIAWHVRRFVKAPPTKETTAPFKGTGNWSPAGKKKNRAR